MQHTDDETLSNKAGYKIAFTCLQLMIKRNMKKKKLEKNVQY